MKFEWQPISRWTMPPDHPAWGLYLVQAGSFKRFIGSLTQLPRAWAIHSNDDKDKYWLDSSLSLEEAQRAAKLFLCVGRQR